MVRVLRFVLSYSIEGSLIDLVRLFAFVEMCRGVDILSASGCGLLSMSSCVVLILKKVSIIQFVYLVRSCVEVQSFSLPQLVKICQFSRVGRVVFIQYRQPFCYFLLVSLFFHA